MPFSRALVLSENVNSLDKELIALPAGAVEYADSTSPTLNHMV